MSVTPELKTESWIELRQLLAAGDHGALRAYVDRLSAGEALHALFHLDADERDRILTTLLPEDAADLVEEVPDEHAADIIERLPPADAAAILSEMQSDDQADVLANLETPDAEAILAAMPSEEAEDVRRLAAYDPDVAGGLMQSEFLSFLGDEQVGDVVRGLGEAAEELKDYEIQSRMPHSKRDHPRCLR